MTLGWMGVSRGEIRQNAITAGRRSTKLLITMVLGSSALTSISGGAHADEGQTARAATVEIAQAAASEAQLRDEVATFDIPAMEMSAALLAFSKVSGVDVYFDGALSNGTTSPAVKGDMPPAEALDRLLSGTGLVWLAIDANTAEITQANGSSQKPFVTLSPVTVTAQSKNIGANGSPDWVYETPGGVSVITRESMEKVPMHESRDLFNHVAGADVANDARDPGLTVSLRGQQEMGRVNVNIDGARQNYNQLTHGTASRVYVDPGLLAAVTIEKTDMDQAGGAGTSAGIVTLRTLDTQDILDDDEDWGGKINVSRGSNSYDFVGNASVAARLSPKFDMAAAVSRRVVGDYHPGKHNPALYTTGNGNLYSIEDVDDGFTFTRQTSNLLKANLAPTEDQEIKFGYVRSRVSYAKSSDVNNVYSDFNETENHTATAKHIWDPQSDLIDLKSNLFWNRTRNRQYRPPRYLASGRISTDSFDTEYTLDTFGADISNTSELSFDMSKNATGHLRFDYGVEYFNDDAETESTLGGLGGSGTSMQLEGSTPSGVRDVYGTFLKTAYGYNDLFEVSAGLRYDRYALNGNAYWCEGSQNPNNLCADGGTPVDVNLSDSDVSPSVGFALTPFPGLQLFANYRENMRAPTIMEAMIKGEHVGNVGIPYYANANLESEKSATKEFGVNLMFDDILMGGDGFRAKLSYFRTKVDNYITVGYVPQPTVTSIIPGMLVNTNMAAAMVNLSDPVDINGVEMELSYDAQEFYLGGTMTLNDLDLKGDYNPFVLDTNYDQYAATGYNAFAGGVQASQFGSINQLFGIYATPKRKITLDGGVRLLDQALNLGMRATFVFPQDNIGSQSLSSVVGQYFDYRTYDFYSSYQINKGVRLGLNVNNLTDEGYVQGTGGTYAPAPGRTAIVSLRANF